MSAFKAGNSLPTTPSWSIKTRLVSLLLVATVGLWGIAALSVYQEAQRDSRELFDESLQETAYLLLTVVEHEMAEDDPDYGSQLIGKATNPSAHYLQFQIWHRDGRLIYRSVDAPAEPLATPGSLGYFWTAPAGESLRTYVAWNPAHTLQIQIAEPLTHREEISSHSLRRLVLFAAFFLPFSAAFVWWIIARSFQSLQAISRSVAGRSAHDLSNVDTHAAPRELAPLLAALNRLLDRVRDIVQHERRFTADAAHELRTPLAAIRAHAQVLLAARNADEASEAARDIINGVDRSRRLMEQLLLMARLDQQQVQPQALLDLEELIANQVALQQGFAAKQRVNLRSETGSAQLHGNADALDMMLRNLIDNALRYTPPGGEVVISCRSVDCGIELAVRDSGAGIPAEERERIFERFYRITGSQSYGSGLGLSIVRRVAEQHSAQLTIAPGLNGAGTGFVLLFPAHS